MMRRVVKMSLGTAVIAVLLGTLFTVGSLALFLQAVYAFTREQVIAEVIMSPIQTDDKGDYIEIDFTPLSYQSALLQTVNANSDTPPPSTTQHYKVYGDTVAIRGALIKLHNGLLFLNFDNIYKLSLIEGEYRRSRGSGAEGSEYPINGGFDDNWWDFNNQEATFPYNLIVQRFTFSGDEEPGFTGNNKKRYNIVVTFDAITWNFIENVPN